MDENGLDLTKMFILNFFTTLHCFAVLPEKDFAPPFRPPLWLGLVFQPQIEDFRPHEQKRVPNHTTPLLASNCLHLLLFSFRFGQHKN